MLPFGPGENLQVSNNHFKYKSNQPAFTQIQRISSEEITNEEIAHEGISNECWVVLCAFDLGIVSRKSKLDGKVCVLVVWEFRGLVSKQCCEMFVSIVSPHGGLIRASLVRFSFQCAYSNSFMGPGH